jgi:hypothetical protein
MISGSVQQWLVVVYSNDSGSGTAVISGSDTAMISGSVQQWLVVVYSND